MKMVLSLIAPNVELCKVAQLHLLFSLPLKCELLHDLLTKAECMYSMCFYHSVLLTAHYITHRCHKIKLKKKFILILVFSICI